ncbi:MAG: hypothetical protein QOD64_422 [Verrucomicrobiota bacterium]|jgi:uncharacterized repeat protein (TIGR03803 family)
MPRIIFPTCSILAAHLFVSIAAMAAPAGPIKTTKTISAFQRPPNNFNSLAVAGDGNLYVASSAQGYLVRVTPDGVFSIIHDFLGDAAGTPSALALGKDGKLYGMLLSNGSIFKSDLAGNISIVATLASADGQTTLIHAADGNLYGTTIGGGSAGHGAVFKVTPAGQVTIIHSFAADIDAPTELIETTPGLFYGICRSGGPVLGTAAIFKVTAEGAFTVVRDFSGTSSHDARNLVFAGDGNVYGSYYHPDGQSSVYSIFRLTPAGELTPIANFGGNDLTDIVVGGDGNLYGTTAGNGTLSRITLSGQVTLLHAFSFQDDGGSPNRLAAGANQVFGLTSGGSIGFLGTVFRVDAAGQFATLVKLGALGEGYSPNGAFFQSADGSFYGATELGGANGYGTLYHVSTSGERTTLHEFGGDAAATPRLLIPGTDGRLYGGSRGVNVNGSVYRIETSGAFTMLHQFSDGDDGSYPVALVAAHDGNIYGVAASSVSSGKYGSFFRITPGGTFTVLKVFDNNLGFPSGLVEAKDGNLYGLASGPVLFRIAPDGSSTTIIHSFSADPIRGSFTLVAGVDGNLYGTASGTNGRVSNGGLWRCSPAGSFAILHSFDGADNISTPSRLVSAANGDLYGVARTVVYRFTAGGAFEPLYTLVSLFGLGLIQGTDGNLYGTTGNTTGPLGGGALFKFVFGKPSAVNLATRMKVGTGNNVSIGGFIITGNVAKKVMLRGIGPSLPMTGKLDNPMLELRDAANTIIGRNDNWRVSQPGGVVTGDQSAAIKTSGLAPIDDRESALLATLQPGNYTAVVSGTQGTTGIGLVEIYALDPEADATLANISTRGFADTGDNVLIGGFITDGSSYGLSKLIVRALGPSLAQFGVDSPLNNPSLSVYDQNGNRQAANDDWQNGNQPEISAAGLAPKNVRESAVYVVLPAGNYSAVVSGEDGGTGVALVETYNLP